MFIAALFTTDKTWKQPNLHQQMNGLKRYGPYMRWNTTQPKKKNEVLPFATMWMALENIILSEMSDRER